MPGTCDGRQKLVTGAFVFEALIFKSWSSPFLTSLLHLKFL